MHQLFKNIKRLFWGLLVVGMVSLIGGHQSHAQLDTSAKIKPNYRALRWILASEAALYTGSVYGLSKVWYKTKFTHFKVADDYDEWKQVDKMGHFFSAYQICRHTAALYQKTGVSRKQAALYGAISGFLFLTPIEILDGFQPDYGFSPSDMAANVLGPALYLGQYALWNEARIQPKFSYYRTNLARVRPELLGRNLSEEWLKDYNGQTYWLSVNVASFLRPSSSFPKWLNVSFGYGVQDMVGARVAKSLELGYEPYRQFYLSLDVDLTRIKTRSKLLKTLFFMANTLKIPAPTLELNSKSGLRWHGLYF